MESMQLLKIAVLAVTVLVATSNASEAQTSGRYRTRLTNTHPKWYGNGYYYGPDGGYAAMKKGSGRVMDANEFCYYEKSKRGVRTVFKRARYAQDGAGRGYLYVAND
jgi:hypothetical protein